MTSFSFRFLPPRFLDKKTAESGKSILMSPKMRPIVPIMGLNKG